jgi:xanthosine utilization system XapX-like protein
MLEYIIAFLAGALVKTVDWLDDTKKSKSPVKYLLGAVYGLLIGYMIGKASFSLIFLAALTAQVFARKVDTTAHKLGFLVAAVSLLWFSFPTIDAGLFILFLALAFLDEIDYIGKLRPINEYRPFLKIGALLPALVFGIWDYFFGIIIFDIGYELVATLTHSGGQEKDSATLERKAKKGSAKAR